MNKTLSTTLIVIAVLALAGGVFFAGNMYARANAYGPGAMTFDWNNDGYAYGPGMMNSQGGYGMMGNYGWNNRTNSNLTPLTVEQAKSAAEKYIQSLNVPGLITGAVMIFDNHGYVIIKESETGLGAFELLVDSASQVAYPEYGPNMLWNLKYGGLGHGSMMGGYGGLMGRGMMNGWNYQTAPSTNISTEMTVTPEQAVEYAQQYLDSNYAGATAATDPMQFYGYYTLDFEKEGQVTGMLSVNGFNGQIFLHTWHGTFIEEAK